MSNCNSPVRDRVCEYIEQAACAGRTMAELRQFMGGVSTNYVTAWMAWWRRGGHVIKAGLQRQSRYFVRQDYADAFALIAPKLAAECREKSRLKINESARKRSREQRARTHGERVEAYTARVAAKKEQLAREKAAAKAKREADRMISKEQSRAAARMLKENAKKAAFEARQRASYAPASPKSSKHKVARAEWEKLPVVIPKHVKVQIGPSYVGDRWGADIERSKQWCQDKRLGWLP